jgi:hydrogenase-4 component F
MGVFMSELLVVSSTFARQPLLAIPLVLGLMIAVGALLLRLQGVLFGPAGDPGVPVKGSYVPLFLHLALVLVAGVYLPAPLVRWFEHVAALLG